jgi:dTMP kinase
VVSDRRGLFVAVDGPKHAGKTTVLDHVVPALEAAGFLVLRTKEPSAVFDLANEQNHKGLDLARLLADDRAHHLEAVVEPGLADHDVVITDRYIGSTLVFQVLDGVPFTQVWEMNERFPLPDVNVIVTADQMTLTRRLERREHRTRFDRQHHAACELEHYKTAATFLRGRGVHIVTVVNDDARPPISAAAATTATILDRLRHR